MSIEGIDKKIYEYNNKPDEKFSGLSPFELHELIHHPFGKNCPIQFQKNISIDILNSIPFFRICEEFLNIIKRDNYIKLTPLGALPKKTMVELYDHKFITEEFIESGINKLTKEQDSIAIQNARYVCEIAKLIKKRDNKLSLTKNGEKHLEDREFLFKLILTTFSFDFNWSINDGYPDEPIAQYGNLYSIYCLMKFGNTVQKNKFYFEKYKMVFHKFNELFKTEFNTSKETQFFSCYEVRTFYRFTDWFGFTQTTQANYGVENSTKSTEILHAIYKFEHKKG